MPAAAFIHLIFFFPSRLSLFLSVSHSQREQIPKRLGPRAETLF